MHCTRKQKEKTNITIIKGIRDQCLSVFRIIYTILEITVMAVFRVKRDRLNRSFRKFCVITGDILGAISIFAIGYVWLLVAGESSHENYKYCF